MTRTGRVGLVGVVLGLLLPWLPGASSEAATIRPCTPRVLVLSAFPGELGPILDAATLASKRPVTVRGRDFYVGRLGGHDVVMAMTGIGLVNATQTTDAAFAHFRCGGTPAITKVLFSGVAGGGPDNQIGDVTVPARWTLDGESFFDVDPAMLTTAEAVVAEGDIKLARRTPLGDPACVCIDPGAVRTVDLGRNPKVFVGGDGISGDTFDGKVFPCIPFGGDTFGCKPCRYQGGASLGLLRRLLGLAILLDPRFILANLLPAPGASDTYVAVDMETAAVHARAARYGRGFLAFRAMSDGHGDPLHLPGFPAQFFFYKQLAADNAAAVTIAFLRAWTG